MILGNLALHSSIQYSGIHLCPRLHSFACSKNSAPQFPCSLLSHWFLFVCQVTIFSLWTSVNSPLEKKYLWLHISVQLLPWFSASITAVCKTVVYKLPQFLFSFVLTFCWGSSCLLSRSVRASLLSVPVVNCYFHLSWPLNSIWHDGLLLLESFSSLGLWHTPIFLILCHWLLILILLAGCFSVPSSLHSALSSLLWFFLSRPCMASLSRPIMLRLPASTFPWDSLYFICVLTNFIWTSNWRFNLNIFKIDLYISNSHCIHTRCLHSLACLGHCCAA